MGQSKGNKFKNKQISRFHKYLEFEQVKWFDIKLIDAVQTTLIKKRS